MCGICGLERRRCADGRVSQLIQQSSAEQSCISAFESSKTATSSNRSSSMLACFLLHTHPDESCSQRSERNTGAPTTDTPSQETDLSIRAPNTDQTETPRRSAPGLDHRLKDRPVGRQPVTPGPATSQSRHAPSPAPNEAQSVPQQASEQSQPPPLPLQTPTQQPRAALQPLSALPHMSQAAAPAQAPVRHADFAGAQLKDQKSAANVQFWLMFHAEFGQRLRVVGSHKNLGMLTNLS